ncbi:MAG TPA: O-antigen ligase family protein [Candidatus Krumholzibacteria bacterium]|nr:O-antigen ligase family protein [Candidatus Krumholzibacteria bacterium]
MKAQRAAPSLERASLLALALSPILAFVALRLLGYLKLAKLGGMALAALAVATVVFVRPRWGLYFLLFYVYSGIGLLLPLNLGVPAIVLVVAAVLVNWVRGEECAIPDGLFWGAVGVFITIGALSMLIARNIEASLVELATFGKILLVVCVIVDLIRTPDHLRALCYAVFIGAVTTVILGTAAIYLGIEGAGENYLGGIEGGIMRFSGLHENPNRAAAILCSALPLGVFAVRHAASRWVRLAFGVGILLIVAAIFATFSRSVIVALTMVLIGVGAYEMRSRRSFIILGAVLALGILLAPRYYWDRVVSLPDALKDSTRDWSVYTRMLALSTAWEMFLNHPITGVGLGNFMGSSAYRLFVRIVVHNTYLEILVSTGIAGLVAFLTMLGAGVRHAVMGARSQWSRHPAWMRSLSFYVCLSALSIFVSAFFASMPFRYPLWVPVAAGLVIGRMLRAEKAAA